MTESVKYANVIIQEGGNAPVTVLACNHGHKVELILDESVQHLSMEYFLSIFKGFAPIN